MTFPKTTLVRASNEPLISVIAVVLVKYRACQARIQPQYRKSRSRSAVATKILIQGVRFKTKTNISKASSSYGTTSICGHCFVKTIVSTSTFTKVALNAVRVYIIIGQSARLTLLVLQAHWVREDLFRNNFFPMAKQPGRGKLNAFQGNQNPLNTPVVFFLTGNVVSVVKLEVFYGISP